jgi:type II secretory ATPase GspE/PulE/Tfp pilus assembly ATPase PilB-like protein
MESVQLGGDGLRPSSQAKSFLSFEQAVVLGALPLRVFSREGGDTLQVAVSDMSANHVEKIAFVCGIDVLPERVEREDLDGAIVRAYREDIHQVPSADPTFVDQREDDRPALRIVDGSQGDIAKFIDGLLEFCAVRRASDLHLTPEHRAVAVRVRIDGSIRDVPSKNYSHRIHEQILTRIKVRAGLDIAQKRLAQDGSFVFRVGSHERNARVSIIPSLYGESVVLRILSVGESPALERLNMEPSTLLLLREALEANEGMILLTGPTGSGKTTTLYALASEARNRGLNVVSVEDPIENSIAGVLQVQVATSQSFDYPEAIRAVLRHDPDVLLIGEIRDALSAAIAVRASTTGHLTLSSLHVGSCMQVFRRLELLNVLPVHVTESVRLVLNQRLLPRLCDRCKSEDTLKTASDGRRLYRANGCPECKHTGFRHRTLVTEALDMQSQQAKDIVLSGGFRGELIHKVPVGSYVPWKDALEYHASRGELSAAQLDSFSAL